MRYFHCCAHKTGSHWITAILSDPYLLGYSDIKLKYLYPWNETNRDYNHYLIDMNESFSTGFPDNTIISPLFTGLDNFVDFTDNYEKKIFYVLRHPKDITISMYYSALKTHYPQKKALEKREELVHQGKEEGIKTIISYLISVGLFQSLANWWAHRNTENVLVVKFEDLIGESQPELFFKIFEFCDINMPLEIVKQYLQSYTLEKMRILSGNPDHYRKGKAGSWVDDWSAEIEDFWNAQAFLQSEHFKNLPYNDL